MRFLNPLPCLFLVAAAGCARYEHEIVQPADLAQRVVAKEDAVIAREPLEYRLRSIENRLVMRIFNPTPQPMTLLGDRGFIVDPGGQSHPLPTQVIAPGSFIKLILPPLRPRVESDGPGISIGVGGGFGDARRRGYLWDPESGFADSPRYFTVYDDGTYYWEWKGESHVRMLLVFEHEQQTIQHEFLIARRKV